MLGKANWILNEDGTQTASRFFPPCNMCGKETEGETLCAACIAAAAVKDETVDVTINPDV